MPDADGFEAFYRANLDRIVKACALVTLDRAMAEDVAAEAFVRLWSRWGQIRGPEHAGGYVFKTAMRMCWKQARRRVWPLVPRADLPTEIDAALARYDVIRAMAGLPFRQRQAVVLRDWAGFETREVAEIMGARESTVRVHLARAREALRNALLVEERDR